MTVSSQLSIFLWHIARQLKWKTEISETPKKLKKPRKLYRYTDTQIHQQMYKQVYIHIYVATHLCCPSQIAPFKQTKKKLAPRRNEIKLNGESQIRS